MKTAPEMAQPKFHPKAGVLIDILRLMYAMVPARPCLGRAGICKDNCPRDGSAQVLSKGRRINRHIVLDVCDGPCPSLPRSRRQRQ